MDKEQIFADINVRLIASLEEDKLTWRQPWQAGIPSNYVTGHVYQGMNFLLLSFEQVPTPYYLTFLQAQQKNLRLKKGSKGRQITFYKMLDISEKVQSGDVKTKAVPYLKFSHVFNLSDLENYEIPQPSLKVPQDILNNIIAIHSPEMRANLSRCYYSAEENCISVPNVSAFVNEEEYFCSVFHELVHWSGHASRLNRNAGITKKDKNEYAFEELVAEIGASYLLGLCGIQNTLDNTAAYLEHWLKLAKTDNSYILSASVQAQKAVNYLLNTQNEKAVQ
jgi:antirestriction protein ArdC